VDAVLLVADVVEAVPLVVDVMDAVLLVVDAVLVSRTSFRSSWEAVLLVVDGRDVVDAVLLTADVVPARRGRRGHSL
jgi:uncharacterized protein YqgC (DUF456 family)